MAAQGGGLFAAQADRYLLGALLAPQFVGFYTVAQRLEEAVYIGVLKVGEILFPFFSALQRESSERKADLLFRSSWVLNVLAASALGALIPVAGPLLHLWTGAEVAAQAQRVLVVLSIAGMLGCTDERIRVLSSRHRPNTIQRADLVCDGSVYAGHQRGGFALLRMAGGGLECLRRHGCPERHDHCSAAAKFQLTLECGRRWLISSGCHWQPASSRRSCCGHFIGDRLFDQYPHWWYVGSLYGSAAGHHLRRRCRRLANWTPRRGLLAGFARDCKSLSSCEGDITMCGIAGIVNFRGNAVEPAEISRLTDLLAHRGPDGEGTWFSAESKRRVWPPQAGDYRSRSGRLSAHAVRRWPLCDRLQRRNL